MIAVTFWIGSLCLLGPVAIIALVYLLLCTRYKLIPLLYLIWYIADWRTSDRGGRRWNWVRRWRLWKDYASYFPISLVKEEALDPKFNYIICSHPHGVLACGAFCSFATEGTNAEQLFPGITFTTATLKAQFVLPIYRELFMTSGAVTVSRQSMGYVLDGKPGGNALVLVVGGAREALSAPGSADARELRLILERRKGFVRLALEHGAHLVPSFSFGEDQVYDQVDNPRGSTIRILQESVCDLLGLAPVLPKNFFPNRCPINVVVGRPIAVDKTENPTTEHIDLLHARYTESLIALFERHKSIYYPNVDVTLRII